MSEDSRISEIRAVLDAYRAPGTHDTVATLARIRAILDRSVRTLVSTGPRTDAVGTVRQHFDGSRAVKVTETDGDALVWCSVSVLLGVVWLRHEDIANDEWGVVVPALPVSETEWGYRLSSNGEVFKVDEPTARRFVARSGGRPVLVRREVGPWTEVQSWARP